MNQQACFQKSYLWRYLAMAGIGVFMALWFAFDGLIGYPREQKRAEAYEKLAEEIADKNVLSKRWREVARNQGWSVTVPDDKAADFQSKIAGQYLFGGISLLCGLLALINYLRSRNRWIESTDEGLVTSWGQQVRFADVRLLNKRRWASKGIAKAHYREGSVDRCFVFDDFKYDRPVIDAMLRRLESHLKPEQIVGGPAESIEQPTNSKADKADVESQATNR